ncbi:MAG: FAD-binding protein [Chitinophagaceae bacterium]
MIKEIQLSLTPEEAHSETLLLEKVKLSLSLSLQDECHFEILKKSIDARKTQVKVNLRFRVFVNEPMPKTDFVFQDKDVSKAKPIHIIGAGPAGLFCALQCITMGYKPILYERGKTVRDRRRDLAKLNKEGLLNEESNYCFGEGGAGTYSDGKLYTRSNKRGNIPYILQLFVFFGAPNSILYEAHPHIGTNKLPSIIEAIRNKIVSCGGEVYFEHKLTNLSVKNNKIVEIELNDGKLVSVENLVLATGHSAKDIYTLLHKNNIKIEAKPFALGVRIEHPQDLIDDIQYHCNTRNEYLPPSSYSLVHQVKDRGVFSFCMCPGGIIAPASTEQKALVVNGWSPSKRNNPFANSGMVVNIFEHDFKDSSPLSGLSFQHEVESKAFSVGGGNFVAPAQRMVDFTKNKLSNTLPINSYLPGTKSALLSEVLPSFVYEALSKAFIHFGQKLKNNRHAYFTNDAIVVATESRTSSPVRIPRNKESFQHIQIENLYPCAEGAGYAGGIVSAAMDGVNIATAIAIKNN